MVVPTSRWPSSSCTGPDVVGGCPGDHDVGIIVPLAGNQQDVAEAIRLVAAPWPQRHRTGLPEKPVTLDPNPVGDYHLIRSP